ncbi:MAG TPA: O-antigen ligase family protein [Sphingobium sp.]
MLLGWPLVTLVLFLTMSTQRAIVTSLVGAYLLLPFSLSYDFPGVPLLDKSSIPNIVTFLLALVLGRSGEFRWIRSVPVNLLLLAYVISPFATGFANTDAVQIGSVFLPGLTLYNSVSTAAGRAIELMPFILGAGLVSRPQGHRDILLVFVLAALAYTPPIFLEVLKGPFIQARLYGIDPGDFFQQQIRGDSFRAMVLMGHGLAVSAFVGLAVLAAVGLWRSRLRVFGMPSLLCGLYLFGVLVLNKSAGSVIFVVAIAPLLALLSGRRFLTLALAIGLVVVTYPLLRASGVIPIEYVTSTASSFSKERAESFNTRVRNEEILLKRANQRPLFGWGGWNRNRVFVVTAWGSTTDITVTDGTWIIMIGTGGWVGYIAAFGLLCYPFWHVFRRRKMDVSPATVALVAMLMFNVLDLIPNSSLRPITWLIAGALAGFTPPRPQRRPSTGVARVAGPQSDKGLATA